jgi:hypothetical protein
MPAVKITSEAISFGFAVFRGGSKLAVVTNEHFTGLRRGDIGICEPLPREQWSVHWCSPSMPCDEAVAVAKFIEALPMPEKGQ